MQTLLSLLTWALRLGPLGASSGGLRGLRRNDEAELRGVLKELFVRLPRLLHGLQQHRELGSSAKHHVRRHRNINLVMPRPGDSTQRLQPRRRNLGLKRGGKRGPGL